MLQLQEKLARPAADLMLPSSVRLKRKVTMIASLTGTLIHLGLNDLVIRVSGVGYKVQASSRCRQLAKKDDVTLHDTQIKDDRIILMCLIKLLKTHIHYCKYSRRRD